MDNAKVYDTTLRNIFLLLNTIKSYIIHICIFVSLSAANSIDVTILLIFLLLPLYAIIDDT